MLEAIFENGFGDGADTLRDGVERAELCLHIGGKRRVRGRAEIDRARPPAVHVDFDPVFTRRNLGPGLGQLDENGVQGFRRGIEHPDPASGHGRSDEVGTRLYAVGQNTVFAAAELFDALNVNRTAACTLNARAERSQEVREVDHLGLPGGIFEYGLAVREDGRHQQIFGAGHRYRIENDVPPFQPVRSRLDVAVLHDDVGAQCLQPGNVEIHRAGTDRTAAGQ